MEKKNNKIVSAVVVLVVIVGVSFYGGMAYAKGSIGGGAGSAQARAGQFGAGQGGMPGTGRTGMRTGGFGGGTFGEVIAKDATSITVKLPTGGSKIVFITPATPVSKDAAGSLNDVAIGTQVTVAGAANADGSISAQTIRIGAPMIRGMGSSTPVRTQ